MKQLKSSSACYAVIDGEEKALSAKDAQAACKKLHPDANLASFHSGKEEDDLVSIEEFYFLPDKKHEFYENGVTLIDDVQNI